jgi:hypothetical protein
MLSITPTGLRSFTFVPTVPPGLDRVYLTNIRAFGETFDVLVDPDAYRIVVNGMVRQQGTCGGRASVNFGG